MLSLGALYWLWITLKSYSGKHDNYYNVNIVNRGQAYLKCVEDILLIDNYAD